MAYQKILIENTDEPNVSRIGGLPLLSSQKDWPTDPETRKPLLLLASLTSGFLAQVYPQFQIPENYCLSIFIGFDEASTKYIDRLSVQSKSQISNLQKDASRVILHRRGAIPCEPPSGAPATIPIKQMVLESHSEDDRNPDMPDRGTTIAKVGGVPGWAQDPIELPGYTYVLQIDDSTIEKISPSHGGIFEDGVGFLFLKNKFEPGDTGVFFIQFT